MDIILQGTKMEGETKEDDSMLKYYNLAGYSECIKSIVQSIINSKMAYLKPEEHQELKMMIDYVDFITDYLKKQTFKKQSIIDIYDKLKLLLDKAEHYNSLCNERMKIAFIGGDKKYNKFIEFLMKLCC